MYSEAWHRVLKDEYLEKKKNRRVDLLLYTLLHYVNDMVFDQLRMLEKQPYSSKLTEILRRHKTALQEFGNYVVSMQEHGAVVAKSDGVAYTVGMVQGVTCDCKLW